MSDPTDPLLEKRKLALSYAAENRKSEIALLWSRSLYFWGFISVILVSYGTALSSGRKTLALFAACFGFLCSLSWTLANRSGKYWQEVWEEKVKDREVGLFEKPLFPRSSNPVVHERWGWGPKQYSPSKLAMAVSDLTASSWIVLALVPLLPHTLRHSTIVDIVALLATSIYAVCILIWCRSGPPQSLKMVANECSRWLRRTWKWIWPDVNSN